MSPTRRASHTSAERVMSLGKNQKRNMVTNGGHMIMRNKVMQWSLHCAASSGSSRIVDRSAGEAEEPVRVSEGLWNGDCIRKKNLSYSHLFLLISYLSPE